ncbi:MAG: tetraacyldisaccharide 4'-kinase [Deltaproteobacteria bacterium]|nr:tetraacyldisaccharide 4'-kinase [Deltaproteobacteria bacterium]
MVFAQRLTHHIWQRQGFWGEVGWLALTPLSLGFSGLVRARNLLYDQGWLAIQRPTLKVISVGNLTVGGTGKTPMVLWLAQALQSRGHRVGILTRGYGGKNKDVTVVGTAGQALATPAEVGDEPVMLARAFAGVVISGRDRVAAAEIAGGRFDLNVVILDDGFQHRQLDRDIDLLLVNSKRGSGNGWLLPAGPLREPLAAARRADVVIITKGSIYGRDGWLASGRMGPAFYGDLKPTALLSSTQGQWHELPVALLGGKRVMTLTGIADPTPFYYSLREWEAEIAEVMEFPDHHVYTQVDWQTISLASQKFDLIVTTEKDLVKLERFPFAAGKLVALRVRMEIEQGDQLLDLVERQLA